MNLLQTNFAELAERYFSSELCLELANLKRHRYELMTADPKEIEQDIELEVQYIADMKETTDRIYLIEQDHPALREKMAEMVKVRNHFEMT